MKQIVKRLLPRPALRAAAFRLPLRQRVRIAKLLAGGPVRTRGPVAAAASSPARAWHDNLQTVTGLLDAAGIDYFCLPHTDPKRSAVAVAAEHRAAVLRLLRRQDAAQVVRTLDTAGRRVSPQRCAVVQVHRAGTGSAGAPQLAGAYACEIEFWATVKDKGWQAPRQVGPRAHKVGTVLSVDNPVQYVPAERLSAFMPRDGEPRYRSRAVYAEPGPTDVRFPIDVVYTWVDGDDPAWRIRKAQALGEDPDDSFAGLATNASRFTSRDELLYSMRSLHAFAPWVNHIYLVTDDQTPSWLDLDSAYVTLVSHKEIFGDVGRLPTFNSHAIESRLHKVPGLAEHFLYFNDDMILGRPVLPTQFFFANGVAKFFPSSSLVDVNPPAPADAPVDVAAKNNRRLLQERFGTQLYQKMRHVPYPLLRSVLEEIETELHEESHATASHQFRDRGDLSIPSSLAHYWAHSTGRSVPGSISHTYIDLGRLIAPVMLARLVRRRNVDVFCLNDTDSAVADLAEQASMVRDFMESYFPFHAPWELSGRMDLTQRTRQPEPAGAPLRG
ncbi:exopolysaccharide phosphotransferase [Catellatospora sp. IY07-71]|uniref:stealth family protein n=1 Tax=Catellatospora sp. IY07-71 TaxID=2728827 RepID=UPI001BB33C9E|nr:stealth family protein [Catellatospora sp. IY07-71]BCJ78019.1 exopolysaccharide phosphotransferase [Catellatospora sp. IY07-71]